MIQNIALIIRQRSLDGWSAATSYYIENIDPLRSNQSKVSGIRKSIAFLIFPLSISFNSTYRTKSGLRKVESLAFFTQALTNSIHLDVITC